MQKWEYAVIRVNHDENYVVAVSGAKTEGATQYLDETGTWGWELVAVVPCLDYDGENRLYFKRPIS